jgi:hypothetical protein
VAGVTASRPYVLNSVGVVVAVRSVARRWQGWPYGADSDGDGAAAGLASWFDPAWSRERGSRVPLAGATRGTAVVTAMSCPRTSQQRWDVATAPGVVLQWRGWPHRADSGMPDPAGPTSR